MPEADPRSKRRRIALACSACRAKKSRCDGAQPKCSACRALGYDCEYMQSGPSSNVILDKEYIVAIEGRLKSVEATINSMESRSFEFINRPSPDLFTTTQQRQLQSDDIGNASSSSQHRGISVHNLEDERGFRWDEDATDDTAGITFMEEESCGFFGPSSNIAFTRHISRTIARVSNISSIPPPEGSLQLDDGLPGVSQHLSPDGSSSRSKQVVRDGSVNIDTLPPRDEAIQLIRKYFSNTGLLFPYLHEETFLETFAEMGRNDFSKIRRTWLGLLNIVLAIATITTVDSGSIAEKRAKQSDIYYQRALGLCGKQFMPIGNLEVVQTLLLMGQYLQGTQKSSEAWTIHGLAVRTAFQLGLQSSEASIGFSALEREARKRTFYGCVVIDRQLSMTFGRPAAIPDSYDKMELPLDFVETMPSTLLADPQKKATVPFFNATITLFRIIWKVIDLCYGGNLGCDKPLSVFDFIPHLYRIEQELSDWERALPVDLRLRQSQDLPREQINDSPDPLERFKVVLTLRYHNVRILLHRPILVNLLDACGNSALNGQGLAWLQQIGSNSIRICMKSSMEIISLVDCIVHCTGARRDLLGSYWSSLYYTFNAALVLFTGLLVCQKTSINLNFLAVSLEQMRESLDKGVEALQLLDDGNRMVKQCSDYLRQLGQVLDSLTSCDGYPGAGAVVMPTTLESYQQGFEDNFALAMTTNQANQPPLGMDLSEFMMDSDLEFLARFSVPDAMDIRLPRGRLEHP